MVWYPQYTDDTQLYISTPEQMGDAVQVLTHCLKAVRIEKEKDRLPNVNNNRWLKKQDSHDVFLIKLNTGGKSLA